MPTNNTDQELDQEKRKNYPGDERQPGTKDYSLILGLTINYRNKLIRADQSDLQLIGDLYHKIVEKLKELGFPKEALSVKKKVGRRKKGLYTYVENDQVDAVVELINKKWEIANKRNDAAKAKKAKEKLKAKKNAS